MKKILILGGTAQQIKLVEAAKKMGVYTIVTDYLVDSPAKKVADEAWMLNIKDVDSACGSLYEWSFGIGECYCSIESARGRRSDYYTVYFCIYYPCNC